MMMSFANRDDTILKKLQSVSKEYSPRAQSLRDGTAYTWSFEDIELQCSDQDNQKVSYTFINKPLQLRYEKEVVSQEVYRGLPPEIGKDQ